MDTINNIYCVGRNYIEHIKELNNMIQRIPSYLANQHMLLLRLIIR